MPKLPEMLRRILLALALAALSVGAAAQSARPRIDKAADLPRFSYKVDGKLEELVRSSERFAPFAAQVRRDVESVLSGHDIADKATQRELIGQLAALDFLDGRYDSAVQRAEQMRALEDKPADKLLSGMRLRLAAEAAKAHGLGTPAYRTAVGESLARELAPLPRQTVDNDIKGAKMRYELLSESLVLGQIREVLQPIVDKTGALSSEFAGGVVGARLALVALLPLKDTLAQTYAAWLAAHRQDKPDIWAARDVTLPARPAREPVRIAVWDSGSDTRLFGRQVLRDARGRPAVIAFDKYSRPSQGDLMPLPAALRERLGTMTSRSKGLSDLQSNLDTPEAAEVRTLLANLTPERYRPEIEEISLASSYQHGTHVAGIALAGNPFARLVVGRISFSHTLKPDPCPSREQALLDAQAHRATVAYFQRQRVRVVNMSWGGNPSAVEAELEQCGIGDTPEQRKALAREYFQIARKSLTEAFAGAPEILFVTAAGNSNDDASFMETIPGGIELPNLLTVGAVDRAGDEAPFTSYGPTVKVHANGYQVESVLPGGARVAFSGTSMASPQVANLAGKLLAVNPRLSPRELVELIVGTAEPSDDGRRRLIHPAKALAKARAAGR